MSATNGQGVAVAGGQPNTNASSGSSTSSNDNKIGGASLTNNRANLIVNYLPQSIKEHDFNMLFSKIGPIKSCKLMFDRQTGYSFGYGFVEYLNEEDAKKAIDAFNGYQIEHKRLKVAFARPNCEETKNTNLYIRNIPPNYDEHNLHELFSQYGEVIQVRLLRDQNTAYSRRIGFVIMATKQMAQLAIQHLDNTVPPDAGNEPIYVKYADEDGKKRHGTNNMLGGSNLLGGGLHHHQQPHHHQQHNFHHQHHGGGGGGGRNHHHQQQQQHHNPLHAMAGQYGQFGQSSGGYGQYGSAAQQSAVAAAAHYTNSNFMLGGPSMNQQTNSSLSNSSLQNLGKMKSNRSGGHQNRYNPIGGGGGSGGAGQLTQASSNGGGGINASNYNPWGMNMAAATAAAALQQQQQQQQQTFSTFNPTTNSTTNNNNNGNPNANLLMIQSGFDNLMSTLGNSNPNANPNPPTKQQQQPVHFAPNNTYLNNTASLFDEIVNIPRTASLNNPPSAIPTMTPLLNDPMKANFAPTYPTNTIYVYGIGQTATESDLYSLFSACGRIVRLNVIKNPKTGLCKGFGFVVFETIQEANYAVHSMNGFTYNNRPLQVSFKTLKSSTSSYRNVKAATGRYEFDYFSMPASVSNSNSNMINPTLINPPSLPISALLHHSHPHSHPHNHPFNAATSNSAHILTNIS